MAHDAEYDTIIIGGGFYGCSLAQHLRQVSSRRVVIIEREPELLQRASYANQARVHNGYHYPRSILTGLRSRINFPRFVNDYRKCIVNDFDKYYAIGKHFSNVTATQYKQFCDRIGAPLTRAPKDVRQLFNPDLIEEVFLVKEYAFDAVKLKEIMLAELRECGVDILFDTEAQKVRQTRESLLEVLCESQSRTFGITASAVLNCTYSRLNQLLVASGLPMLHLKHELTEMCLLEVPDEVRGRAFTIMCGPFFSIMPFPSLGAHTLSHVRYTPHCEWKDSSSARYRDPYEYLRSVPKNTKYLHMVRDAARYMPCLNKCKYTGKSIWEIKTVLPKSEADDSRPVLCRRDCGLPNLTCLMGGKIDNTYDIIEFEKLGVA